MVLLHDANLETSGNRNHPAFEWLSPVSLHETGHRFSTSGDTRLAAASQASRSSSTPEEEEVEEEEEVKEVEGDEAKVRVARRAYQRRRTTEVTMMAEILRKQALERKDIPFHYPREQDAGDRRHK